MANEFIIKNGYFSQGNSTITGSLTVTNGITGSLHGTASWANNSVTSSYIVTAQTASYVLNAISASRAATASYFFTSSVSTASYVANTFTQGGNSFGTTATFGTNDTQRLDIETNSQIRLQVFNDGNIRVQPSASMRPFMDGMYIDVHPEASNQAIVPYLGNDIAYNTLRGGTFTGTPGPGSTVVTSTATIEAIFDGAPTYAGISSNTTQLSGSYTASIVFPESYAFGNTIGVSFGNPSWRAKDFTVEILVTGSYYVIDTVTNWAYANYNKSFNTNNNNLQGARITFSNFNSSLFRIADIFLLNYNGRYGKEIYLGKDGGQIYKGITVTGSVVSTAGFTGSLQGTSSWANNAITASFITTAQTASYVLNAKSASLAQTASYVAPLTQNVLISGSLTAEYSGSKTEYPFKITNRNADVGLYIDYNQLTTPQANRHGLLIDMTATGSVNALTGITSNVVSYGSAGTALGLNINAAYNGTTPNGKYTIGAKILAGNAQFNYGLQILDGSEGYGKVLTCVDGNNGFANWVDPNTLISTTTGSLFGTASYALNAGTASYALTSDNPVNIGNTNLTITADTRRVLSHSGTSRFIISGSTSTNAALEIESTSTGNSRILVMRQQLNGESTKYAQRSITTGGDSLDSSEFNGWSTDSIFEATGSSTPVPPNKLKGFQWAIFNGTDYIIPLNISSSGNVGIGTTSPNAKLDVTGNTIITGSLNNGLGNTIGLYSHAEGINTLANGIYSHAEGQSTTTFGTGSHAEGTGSVASGSYSHAEGWRTITFGSASHSEGQLTTASAHYSHAEGFRSITVGSYSHSEGQSTIASGSASHAEGLRSVSRGLFSHAEGGGTASEGFGFELDGGTAHGEGSHAEGAGTIASGSFSHAEGQDTVAIGQASHAEGRNTLARAWGSHAEGFFTIASGYISHAEGYNTHASGSYQHVQGQYNMSSSVQSAFIIGNGVNDSNRSNLVFAAGSSFQITGSIDFDITGTTRHAKIFTGTTPNPNPPSLTSTLISNFGVNGHGLILQSGATNDNDIGGIKITDDGVAIWGSGDNDLFRAVNEDSNSLSFVITNNGSVGIGMATGSTAYQLHLSLDSAAKPSTNTWTISSDSRLKENIIEADYDMCYDIVKNLPLKRYTWKPEAYTNEQVPDRTKLGWIAQDVEALFPKAVSTHSFSGVDNFHIDDCKSLNSDQIYAAMYGTIKKLIIENDTLKSELQAIKTHIGL